MRPFSNIMPNFAANLHLLVDSIRFPFNIEKHGKNKICCLVNNTY